MNWCRISEPSTVCQDRFSQIHLRFTVLVGDLWQGRFGIRSNDSDNANHHVKHINWQTPKKINMKPTNHPIEKERSSSKPPSFSIFGLKMLIFPGCISHFTLNLSIRLFAWTSWNILTASFLFSTAVAGQHECHVGGCHRHRPRW